MLPGQVRFSESLAKGCGNLSALCHQATQSKSGQSKGLRLPHTDLKWSQCNNISATMGPEPNSESWFQQTVGGAVRAYLVSDSARGSGCINNNSKLIRIKQRQRRAIQGLFLACSDFLRNITYARKGAELSKQVIDQNEGNPQKLALKLPACQIIIQSSKNGNMHNLRPQHL